jgi:hypothetical protein
MPFETSCDDTQKRHVKLNPRTADGSPGELPEMPTYSKVSGEGTFVADSDGLGVYVISEDNVQGNGPFDTVYEVKSGSLSDQIILHVSNDIQTQPATDLGMSADAPEPK